MSGYPDWTIKPFRFGVLSRIDGTEMTFQAGDEQQGGLVWSTVPAPASIEMHARNRVVQMRAEGGDYPEHLGEAPYSIGAIFDSESDYLAFQSAASRGGPVQVFFGNYMTDSWLLAARNSGQTEFRTGYPMAYNGGTISHASMPPKSYVDGVSQTIVTSTPGLGEIQVPTTASGNPVDVIVAPAGLTGTRLRLHYPVAPFVLIDSLGEALPTQGKLVATLSMRAQPLGGAHYTPLAVT